MLLASQFRNARDKEKSPHDAYLSREGVCQLCPVNAFEETSVDWIIECLMHSVEQSFRACRMHFRTKLDSKEESNKAYEHFMRLCALVNERLGLGCFYGLGYTAQEEAVIVYFSFFQPGEMPASALMPASKVFETLEKLGYERNKVKSGE